MQMKKCFYLLALLLIPSYCFGNLEIWSVSATTTTAITCDILKADASGGDVTVNLHSASGID